MQTITLEQDEECFDCHASLKAGEKARKYGVKYYCELASKHKNPQPNASSKGNPTLGQGKVGASPTRPHMVSSASTGSAPTPPEVKPILATPAMIAQVDDNFSEGIKTVIKTWQTDLQTVLNNPAYILAITEASRQYSSLKISGKIQENKQKNMSSIR